MKIVVGISGGSGAIYSLALLKVLQELKIETHLVVSTMGEYVMDHECGVKLDELKSMATYFHDNKDFTAPIASGSFKVNGMVIVPCSMKTLSSVSNGFSESLLTRAADVNIKEGRKLVLVPRETPLSPIHLENMLKLSKIGVTILPACPGFYNHPERIDDIVYNIVGRILDQIGVDNDLFGRWQGV
ncbi:UbiX family flavin prenyltransferase [Sporanaerobacter acetigenes]|jgi:flavin prenyltransferase|uniref:Flavin prenyltransferase UbiX n=1 Tax=Sporanaerobacter acetigenes DSM 13106 TaxID=1123281 RepID=A0A1M5YTM0_9FIRM|nr:UbiX family flavin prenyltransferase [Sporanaerobacter acetigenes]SHI15154.1 4-hydroxy-3-polyprenylbenzoate decarboxylase [Sporanaerobacter acetigenes DSM 13106]